MRHLIVNDEPQVGETCRQNASCGGGFLKTRDGQ